MKGKNVKTLNFNLLIISVFILNACAPEEKSVESELADSAESAIASISGIADDPQMSTGFAVRSEKNGIESIAAIVEKAFLPKAFADSCQRAASQACMSGVKSIDYAGCTIGSSYFTLVDGDNDLNTPSVNLAFSQNDCSMAAAGDEVSRTYDYKIVGPRGGSLRVSSNALSGSEPGVSGGGKLTYNGSSSWTIQLLGKNKVLTGPGGREWFNHSILTTQDIQISGGLARANRVVESGQIKVFHNLADFTVTHTINQLAWNSMCCHPVSGSVTSIAEGKISGSFSITFNSCGKATVTKDDKTREVELSYCE